MSYRIVTGSREQIMAPEEAQDLLARLHQAGSSAPLDHPIFAEVDKQIIPMLETIAGMGGNAVTSNKDRIKFINDRLDEVVLHRPRLVQLEELEPNTWALILHDREGSRLHLAITGQVEITWMEEAV